MTNVLARQLAANLHAYRLEHGLTLAELGALLGQHRTYLGRIEAGEENVTLAKVTRLANQLGLHPAALLDGDIVRAERQGAAS